jgi:hypothetical protein
MVNPLFVLRIAYSLILIMFIQSKAFFGAPQLYSRWIYLLHLGYWLYSKLQ